MIKKCIKCTLEKECKVGNRCVDCLAEYWIEYERTIKFECIKKKELLLQGFKKCSVCLLTLTVDKFYKYKSGTPNAACKICKNARDKPKQTEQEIYERARNTGLKRRYGITSEEWNALFLAQDCKCAVCKKPNIDIKRFHTDHDHQTGKVRGILCYHCNTLLGYAKDKIEILKEAVKYLEKSNW